MRLTARLEKLEQGHRRSPLPQYARRWLGLTLTPSENARADREQAEAGQFDREAIASDPVLSKEAKEWLLQA